MIFSVGALILLILFTITVHEYAHGLVAFFRGDKTAHLAGRLTLNPLRHIDPLWTVLLPLLLIAAGLPAIGMARPVPVNFMNLRRPKRDMVWVALAGPLANVLFAFLLAFLYRRTLGGLWLLGAYMNLGLALFNLMPVPPLDGSRVLLGLLPLRWAREYVKMERFGFVIVLALVALGWMGRILVPAINAVAVLLGLPAIQEAG
jgi:Zn-dependent protease